MRSFVLTCLGVLVVALLGCASSARREFRASESPNEFLKYKQELLLNNSERLDSAQRNLLMRHPGPSTREVDSFVDSLLESNQRFSDAERAGIDIGTRQRVQGEQSVYSEENVTLDTLVPNKFLDSGAD